MTCSPTTKSLNSPGTTAKGPFSTKTPAKSTPLKTVQQQHKETQTDKIFTSLQKELPQTGKKSLQDKEGNIKFDSIKSEKKICIISSNNRNKVLDIAVDSIQNYNICHYLCTHGGVEQLLAGIQNKIENFTLEDYCIIMIGEADFKETKNYFQLVKYIREKILEVQHTNVIICLPTFIFNGYSTMFRTRVETFNNLLYMDNLIHEYAFIFDSNLELTYDYGMFSKLYGTLNDNGMRNICNRLSQSITEINSFRNKIKPSQCANTQAGEKNSHMKESTESMFFL